MTVGFPDYGGIASVNVPLPIFTTSAKSIGAGGGNPIGPFNVAGQSYTIKFDPTTSAGSTNPFTLLEVITVDANNFIVDDIIYDVPMSTVSQDCEYVFKGPLNGGILELNVDNTDTVTMDYNMSVNISNVPLLNHTATTQVYNSVAAGFTVPPNCSPRRGIIGMNYRSALAAGGNDAYIAMPAPGLVAVNVRAVTPANPIEVRGAPFAFTNGYSGINGGQLLGVRTDATGLATLQIYVPRTSLSLHFLNTGAGATDYVWSAVYGITGT